MIKLVKYAMGVKMASYSFLSLLLLMGLGACHQKTERQAAVKTQSNVYYTCSMHPQIHEDHDGNCPICSMKLIRVEQTSAMGNKASDKIVLTATQIQLAAIKTDTVKEQNSGNEKTLTGTVTINETGAKELSARLAGRIQKLFVRAIGEKITIGQPVYAIYSEELQEVEKEFLLAKQEQKVLANPDIDYKQLIASAVNKLELWGLSPSQINSLAALGKVSPTTIILSNVTGTVSDIALHDGDYITEGMPLLKVQSLNNLWVEAQLYASETGNYKVGNPVTVSFPDIGGKTIRGKVEFINPELSETSKLDIVRIRVPNANGLIRPGMMAYIMIGNGGNKTLAVPASAVLTDEKGSMVWVKNSDGSFSSKMVIVGSGNQSYIPIVSGLNAGALVVTNGVYLLNSEAIFKNGNNMMGGMKM